MPRLRFALCGLMIALLSACSVNNASNASCDFVRGTNNNQSMREASGHDTGSADERQKDVGIGFLNVIFGGISRALSSDKSSDGKCL
ncbi:hypothetical protein L5M43_13925 [Shewanella sp. SW36]|uniref:hypothetical protein n=1 Tax=unclassified Shewanella TaxID=196818 RepID=UPI0021D98C81|nr:MULTISPECIES: hypothetical protein [unclassified Shewanella]MCU7976340.1 hypothetical protein [Shewanella sp. SW36]MCU7991580.1 hypothetical protein [Shewanella sp. SW1]MCU8018987.1 hypothetical protein [Shewanella sp. SM72]MCU8052400.1 hypothetical protein [Shewanella sp. SM43]